MAINAAMRYYITQFRRLLFFKNQLKKAGGDADKKKVLYTVLGNVHFIKPVWKIVYISLNNLKHSIRY